MSLRSAVVVVVDRLGAGFLGPYGATWLDTPAFNALASQSLLIEHALSDSPELDRVYRSFWTGRHAAMEEDDSPTLAALAAAAGCRTMLVTDDSDLAHHRLAAGFQEARLVPRREMASAAERVEQTQLAALFAAAGEALAQAPSPFLLWIHAEGMQGSWDAPWELRAQWTDEDEPPPPDFVAPPARRLPEEVDPDALLGVMHAYAGQVAALNECFEEFFSNFLETGRARDALLAFAAPRGYPLGEHGRIGPVDPALYGETLRIPLLVRYPDGLGAAHRSQAIVQPADLFATLAEWLEARWERPRVWGRSLAPLARGDDWPRDRALSIHQGQRALRTPAWFLRQSRASPEGAGQESATADEGERAELFVKPDDQWEVNEVSDRVPAVVEELLTVLDNLERAVRSNDASLLTPLSDPLREGVG